jgi:hypothetical protein
MVRRTADAVGIGTVTAKRIIEENCREVSDKENEILTPERGHDKVRNMAAFVYCEQNAICRHFVSVKICLLVYNAV